MEKYKAHLAEVDSRIGAILDRFSKVATICNFAICHWRARNIGTAC